VLLLTGIAVATIDEQAAQDYWRRKLYAELGASTLDATKVFQLILSQHAQFGKSNAIWYPDDIVAHARFLYAVPFAPRNSDMTVLKVVVQGTHVVFNTNQVYMDDPDGTFRISDIFGKDSQVIWMIDDRYLKPANQDWLKWLQNTLKIATLPRLSDIYGGDLTTEFKWLLTTTGWLLLICDHWAHYGPELQRLNVKAKEVSSTRPVPIARRK
jgi:hypothetical protein